MVVSAKKKKLKLRLKTYYRRATLLLYKGSPFCMFRHSGICEKYLEKYGDTKFEYEVVSAREYLERVIKDKKELKYWFSFLRFFPTFAMERTNELYFFFDLEKNPITSNLDPNFKDVIYRDMGIEMKDTFYIYNSDRCREDRKTRLKFRRKMYISRFPYITEDFFYDKISSGRFMIYQPIDIYILFFSTMRKNYPSYSVPFMV